MIDYLKTLDGLGGVTPIGSGALLPLSDSEIEQLENLAGAKFPEDYRRFLSQTGGFVFNEEIGFPTEDPLPEEFSENGLGRIDGFYPSAQADVDPTATLRSNIESSPDFYAKNLIAIGDDGAGGTIVLDLNPSSHGTVLYFPQGNDWYDDELPEDPYVVAKTFEEFIASLRPDTG